MYVLFKHAYYNYTCQCGMTKLYVACLVWCDFKVLAIILYMNSITSFNLTSLFYSIARVNSIKFSIITLVEMHFLDDCVNAYKEHTCNTFFLDDDT